MTALDLPDACPTPDKKRYRSKSDAKHDEQKYIRPGGRARLYPYECATGDHWHLTHYTPEEQRTAFDQATHTVGLSATSNTFEGFAVRHVVVSDQPFWIGRDVCDAVGIKAYRDALAQLDCDERVSVAVDTLGGPQKMVAVTEAGVWSLLMISRSPKVKPFKRWLTHEVLPAIRRTGRFEAATAGVAMPTHAEALRGWAEQLERAEHAESKVRELAVPASAFRELAEAAGDYSVADAAKVLSRDPNIKTGERRLFQFMCGIGWVRKRDGRWKAYQEQIENGRLAEKMPTKPYWHEGRGEYVNADPSVRITPKGIAELHKRLGGSGQLALVGAAS